MLVLNFLIQNFQSLLFYINYKNKKIKLFKKNKLHL